MILITAFFLFFIDIFIYTLCLRSLTLLLLCYYFYLQATKINEINGDSRITWLIVIYCGIGLQDFLRYGSVGLVFSWLIPLIILMNKLQRHFFHSVYLCVTLAVTASCIIDAYLIRAIVLNLPVKFGVTMEIVFVNLIIGLALLGLWGNRFFLFKAEKRGKSGLRTG